MTKDDKTILINNINDRHIQITHCIFDMDGLMLDTERIYSKCYADIALRYGKIYTDEIKVQVMGRPELDGANVYVRELGIPITGEQFLAIFKPMARARLHNPPFLPGVEKLIRHLAQNKIPIGVATSSHIEDAAIKTASRPDIFKLFRHTVCGSSDPEVKRGKPAPDIYEICAARFPGRPKAENVLVFEDAPNGVEGAITAGMSCVFVPAKEIHKHLPAMLKKQPTLLIHSMEHFKPELFNLPKYGRF